jgi:type VI secretion system protein ImpF
MAELIPKERRQPCLLDRLTDDEAGAKQESRDRRVMSTQQIRRAVLRDLAWLLNAAARAEPDELKQFPQIASSVLNYGLPDLCGTTQSSINVAELERTVLQAIRRFEPRILPGTLSVRAISNDDTMSANSVCFEIRGTLWAQPMPEPLYIKTDVDLETGQCMLQDRSHG